MVNIAIALRNMSQLMLFKSIKLAKNHKKKIIFALILLVLGYIAKKKLTLGHLVKFAELFSKVVELLPLPQASKLRQLAEYSHSESSAPKAIYECMNVKGFQKRIEQKQNCFQQMKYEHLTGAVLTVVLYNVNAFYFLIQNKYSNDFLELNAATEFEMIMHEIRKRFTEEMPGLFRKVKELLYQEIGRIELQRICGIHDFMALFEAMVQRLLAARFDVTRQQIYTAINRVSGQAKNRFVSEYEYTRETKSTLGRIGSGLFGILGGLISYGDWFPSPKVQITDERLDFIKYAYFMPLKKARAEAEGKMESASQWPNQEARELFQLVTQELEFGLQSLNFSLLLRAYANYNLKILRNRLRKFMIIKNKSQMSVLALLATLHKILNQQFFKPNQFELRDAYHNLQLKKSIKLVSLKCPSPLENQAQPMEQQQQRQPTSEQQHILEEIYLKNSFQYLQKECELKFYNERSGVVLRTKKGEGGQADEMQRLLSMMGASEPLNQRD